MIIRLVLLTVHAVCLSVCLSVHIIQHAFEPPTYTRSVSIMLGHDQTTRYPAGAAAPAAEAAPDGESELLRAGSRRATLLDGDASAFEIKFRWGRSLPEPGA